MVFLKISQNLQKSTSAGASFLMKLQASTQYFINIQVPAQVCFCAHCLIFKSTYFVKHLRKAASEKSFQEVLMNIWMVASASACKFAKIELF